MNRFKFWRWGKLRRLGRTAYIVFFSIIWTIVNVGLGIYREINVLGWTWEEVYAFQSQMIVFVLLSGGLIGWFTWDIGDEDSKKLDTSHHVLDTDRLILRKMNQVDFKDIYKILSDESTMQHLQNPLTKDEVRTWILTTMESYARNEFGRYIVQRKEDGKIVGDVGFTLKMVNGLKEVCLGYIIHKPYQMNGYGLEASRACLEFGLNELGLQRIVVAVTQDNRAGEQIARKLKLFKAGEYNDPKNNNKRTDVYIVDQSLNEHLKHRSNYEINHGTTT